MCARNAAKVVAVLLALCLFAAGCQQPAAAGPTPVPTAADDPPGAKEAPDDVGTTGLERLPLPEGYEPLTAPAPAGISEREIRHIEYEDLVYADTPAFDLSAVPDRLWPEGGYDTERWGGSQSFTHVDGDGQKALFYWDYQYATYYEYDPKYPALTKGLEEAQKQTEDYLAGLLGSDAYVTHPQKIDDAYYLRNYITPGENSFTFIWDQTVDGMPVADHKLSAIVGEGAVNSFNLNWGVFEPTKAPLPGTLLTMEQALYSLNYARSQVNPLGTLPKMTRIIYAELALSARFTDRPTLFRPAWKFVLVNGENTQEMDTVLVDVATGDVSSDHDGRLRSAYPALASYSLEMAAGGLEQAEAGKMLKEYVETAWSGIYSLTVPELPPFVVENVVNVFNYLWSEYRIELIKRKYPLEQAKTPPQAYIKIRDMSVDGVQVRVSYECSVQIDRDKGATLVSFFDSAVFVFRDGRWMLKSAGTIWNGQKYIDTYYGIWHDGPLSVAREAVRRRIERIDVEDEVYDAPEWDESGLGC